MTHFSSAAVVMARRPIVPGDTDRTVSGECCASLAVLPPQWSCWLGPAGSLQENLGLRSSVPSLPPGPLGQGTTFKDKSQAGWQPWNYYWGCLSRSFMLIPRKL